MKRRTLLLSLCLLALLMLTGCGSSEAEEAPELPAEAAAPALEHGAVPKSLPAPSFTPLSVQEQNRLNCAAHYAEHEGKIYSNYFQDRYSFRFGCVEKGKGMGEYELLLNEPVSYCEFIDRKLYVLTCQCESSGLYRCSPDMSEKELILSLPGYMVHDRMQYYEGYFYFTDKNKGDCFYRLSIDGTEPELIVDRAIYYPLIHDGWLLYQDDGDGESLHWMELSSGKDYKITSKPSANPYFDGEYIYFSGKYDDEKFYRIRHDGTEEKLIMDMAPHALTGMDENHIYFVEEREPYLLYRFDKGGGNLVQLGSESCLENPYVIEGRVFATKIAEDGSFFYDYLYLDAETGEYIDSLN